jgi:hypothetical protein
MNKMKKMLSIILVTLFTSTTIYGQSVSVLTKNITDMTGKPIITSHVPANPFSEVSSGYGLGNVNESPKALFDVQFQYPIMGTGTAGIETDGNYFYITRWNSSLFYRYNLTGTLVDSFSIAGVANIRDLAYDGQYFYGGAAANLIYKMNFTAHTLVSTITGPTSLVVRHICYDPGQNALWCGNWATDFTLVNMSGAIIATIPATTHLQTDIYGSAYDNYTPGGPYLWLYRQTSANGNDLAQVKISTGIPTAVNFDVTTVVTVPTGNLAGGLCIAEGIVPNKASLIGVVQNQKFWGLELKDLAVFPNDLGVTSLLHPLSSDLLTNSDSIKVVVRNFDSIAHNNIAVTYSIDGGAPVNDVISANIPAYSTVNFTFLAPFDFSIPGHNYHLKLYTGMPGDANNINDTLVATVKNLWDVAPVTIDEPPVSGPGSILPKATFINNGTLATTFNVTMNITGGYTSTKTITNLAPGANQQVTFDPWNATIGNYTIQVYTVLAADSLHNNDTISQAIGIQNLVKAFCYIAYDPATTGTLPNGPAVTYLQAPFMINSLADQTALNFIEAGTWGALNKWYGVVSTDNTLVTIDTTTGGRTILGNTGVPIAGITYDWTTNTMYGVSWDGVNTSLYKINVGSGATTLVGQSTTQLLINLACSPSGQLFSVSITNDSLYSLNKTNGVATAIGLVGFDAAYAQDMEFDQLSGICYMAAYNNTSAAGELRTVNLSNGSTTLIGQFLHGAEITALAIPFNGPVPQTDAGVISVDSPESACSLGLETLGIRVMNYGTTAINNLQVAYILDGGTPVTETISGNIAPGAVAQFSFSTQIDLSAGGAHNIKVFTKLPSDAITSNDTVISTITNINPVTIPYSMGFEPTDNMTGWKILDANNDTYKWYLATTGGNTSPYCMMYSYNVSSAANDWLITSCIDLNAAKSYKLSYYYKAASATYPEKMKVFIGNDNTIAALTTELVNHSNIVSISYLQGTATFTVPSSGVYYLGFQCYSAADEYNLFLDDINISDVTGVETNQMQPLVSIIPNPATDKFTVISDSDESNITVLNTYGSVVYSTTSHSSNTIIYTGSFSSGIYFVKTETAKGINIQKIIIGN